MVSEKSLISLKVIKTTIDIKILNKETTNIISRQAPGGGQSYHRPGQQMLGGV